MTAMTRRSRPLRVTLAQECELVCVGFAAMMAPYAGRVQVVPSPGGIPARDVDLTLHDTLSGVQELPVGPLDIAHDGKLVTWTWNARTDLVELALANGVSGILSKELPSVRLVAAFEAIRRGRQVIDLGDSSRNAPVAAVPEILTPREAEVISMITQGLTNQTIAQRASISINSLKSYIRSAYRKMEVTSRSQAVMWGVRHGYAGPIADDDDADQIVPVRVGVRAHPQGVR